MGTLLFRLLFIAETLVQHALQGNVVLTKTKDVVLENTTVTLTCSKTVGSLTEAKWYISTLTNEEAIAGCKENKCIRTTFLKNDNLYNCSCDYNRSVSVHLKHVDRWQNGTSWTCKEGFGNKSNALFISVLVPLTHVVLHQSKSSPIIENSTITFHCNTSYSLPPATIRWYRCKDSSKEELTNITDGETHISREEQKRNDNVVMVEETLTYTVKRSVHRWKVYCIATNLEKDNLTSNKIELSIIYPPDGPPVIHEFANGSTFKVIENRTASLLCSVEGGNPLAGLKWVCMNVINNGSKINTTNTKVTSNLTWTAMRTQENTCICQTDHELSNDFTYIKIDILYPPEALTLHVHNETSRKDVTAIVKLIESKTYSLNCSADGNPPPKNYIWRGPKYMSLIYNGSLGLQKIQRDQNGTYVCEVQNIMTPTYGENETGAKTTSINVDVLYKPTLSVINNHDVEEGSSLNVTCVSISSNPNKTDIKWNRNKNDLKINSSQLSLQNISRNDSMNYTCTMTNTMSPTVGIKEEGQGRESFYLNVWYRATVKNFKVSGHENETPVVANESTTIQFICEIDSNPVSNTSIILPNGTDLWSADSNNMSYSHFLSSCLDSGKYTCSGNNKYNHGRPENDSLSLLVNCKPVVKYPVKEDIRTDMHVPVTLQFTATAYPEPEFTWEIWANSSWSIIENDTMFSISSSDMKSNLTITNFTSTQAVLFRLVVENFLGSLTQHYTLQPFDRPEKPSDFRHIEMYLTDNTVMLSWRPGFNGGLPQNFTIKYRQEIDQEWNTLLIPDTGQDLMNFTVHGLNSRTVYVFQIYASNIKNSSDILEISVTTKAAAVEKKTESNALVIMVVGSLSGVLVISGGVVFGILLCRKGCTFKRKTETGRLLYQNIPFSSTKKTQNTKTLANKETAFHHLQELDDNPTEYNEPTEYYNSSEKIEQMKKIRVPELLQYVSDRTEEAFAAEYLKLQTGLQKPCTFARKPENIAMNRYNGIYPYDHSRVKIPGQPDFFINACYIHGYTRQNAYIASLGPTKKVTDNYRTFWMMVWSEQSDIIVMLTNLQEPSGMKCEQYWPDSGTSILCGDIEVTCDREDVYAEYTARLLTVSNAHDQRSVTHLHYTAWPDKKVPEDVTTLIEFRERMKATPSSKKGAMIVHCSAGIGRTGTLIALDRLIEEGQCESAVDVFKCVDDMREQRVKMVQTQEQYIYIYQALVNRLYFDCEMIPVESFQEYVSMTNNNIYSKQFQQLKESVETCSKEERDARAANQLLVHKNRLWADIPGDQNRVRIYLNRQMDESDYINAVYVHSFKKKDHFISAQSPLPETVSHFLCMLYQENCCCVVTMEDLKEPGLAVGRYLPSGGKTLKVGRFEVSCTTLETKAQYTVREMKIKYSGQYESGEKAVYHFQYNKWVPGSDVPSDPKEFIQFIQDVEDYSDQLGEEDSHILVHCLKANERSGLYCIVAILMEKIRYERQVSILNTVRHFRTRRRTALTSMEQLKFCYTAVSAYINMYVS